MSEYHYLQLSNQFENQYKLIDDGDMDSLKMHGQDRQVLVVSEHQNAVSKCRQSA